MRGCVGACKARDVARRVGQTPVWRMIGGGRLSRLNRVGEPSEKLTMHIPSMTGQHIETYA